ncbi:MAG TPA: alpha/beta hydrolase [Steroidobacteraceae bacterium]|nr:alpha/beta hydrolase [Steroidobacteraceae bacterium]
MRRREMLAGAVTAAAGSATLSVAANAATQGARGGKSRPRGGMVQGAGVRLFHRDWGDGAPMVFLSGWALTSVTWGYVMMPCVEGGFRCIAYDRRGHGRSEDPGRGYDFDTLADDLASLLDALDLRDVTLVGHSMASGEMVRYLTRHGSARIARTAFVAPASTPFLLKTADNPDGFDASLFEAARRDYILRDFPGFLAANARPFVTPETSEAMIDWVLEQMLQTSLQAVVECHHIMTSTDFRAELPRITVPSLVIHGDKDVSARLDLTGRRTAQMIPAARLEIYEGAPHGLFVTHASRLARDLIAFARG